MRSALEKITLLLTGYNDQSPNAIKSSAFEAFEEIVKLSQSPETVKPALEIVTSLLADGDRAVKKVAYQAITIFTSNFSTNVTDFQKFLNHVDTELRDQVLVQLIQIMKNLLAVAEANQTNITVPVTAATTKQTILDKQHTVIKYALAIIAYNDIITVEPIRKELITLAKKLVHHQIERLNESGLQWMNAEFAELATLSTDSKTMFKKVYHRIAQDLQHISETKKQLIIKFINAGITTSLTRKGEIILEGKQYKMRDQNIQSLLEQIAKAVINQDTDILAYQYRDYRPIFPKSDAIGMRKATSDIAQLSSILSKAHTLNNQGWMLTSLVQEQSKAVARDASKAEILLLEQRSSLGDHSAIVLNSTFKPQFRPDVNRSDREHNIQALETIFGAYKPKTVYNAKIKMLSDVEGQRVAETNNKVKLTFATIDGESGGTGKYFQQELLSLGHEDRLAYIDKELAQKVTDNTLALQDALDACKPKLAAPEMQKLREYYSAFILTFSSLYTASQAVDSGQLCVDTSNLTTSILSTLASFAPFGIGDQLSSGIEKINDFITGNKMGNEAKLVKKLAADAVELSTIVGDVGRRIVLHKTMQKKIITATEPDPSGVMSKLKAFIGKHKDKLADYNLAEKELNKTPAAALGEDDANALITEWLSQNKANAKEANVRKTQEAGTLPKRALYLGMKNEELKTEFTRLIIGDTSSESPEKGVDASPNKKESKINPEKAATAKGDDDDDNKNKTSCCTIFRAEIRYANPLLNNAHILQQLTKQLALSQIIKASHQLMADGHTTLLVEVTNSGDINLLKETLMAALSCDIESSFKSL